MSSRFVAIVLVGIAGLAHACSDDPPNERAPIFGMPPPDNVCSRFSAPNPACGGEGSPCCCPGDCCSGMCNAGLCAAECGLRGAACTIENEREACCSEMCTVQGCYCGVERTPCRADSDCCEGFCDPDSSLCSVTTKSSASMPPPGCEN